MLLWHMSCVIPDSNVPPKRYVFPAQSQHVRTQSTPQPASHDTRHPLTQNIISDDTYVPPKKQSSNDHDLEKNHRNPTGDGNSRSACILTSHHLAQIKFCVMPSSSPDATPRHDSLTHGVNQPLPGNHRMLLICHCPSIGKSTCMRSPRDNNNDHSSSQLSVHKALTCPAGQSAWVIRCLVWRIARVMQKECI